MLNKRRFGFINFLIVFVLVILFILIKTADSYEDYNPTVIVQKNQFHYKDNVDLLKGTKVVDIFKAKNDNLGIVSVKFNTYKRINDDYLQFRIKEEGSNQWYYSNKYKVDQFQNKKYFPFGFPEIINSKGKTYRIEIESLSGSENNLVQAMVSNPFLSKYSFSKTYLLQNKINIPGFIFYKIKSFFDNVDVFYNLFLLIIFSVCLFVLKFRIVEKLKIFLKKTRLFFWIRNIFNNKKTEIFIVLLIYILITIFLSKILFYRNMYSQNGDTTFASQIILNISKDFNFDSSYARSINYSFKDVWYKDAGYVCSSVLVTPEKYPPWSHFYFIAYPLGLLLKFFDIYWFIAFSHAIIYSSVLLFVYAIARKFRINFINSALLVLIAAQHPLWLNGMYGQFYFNRFFLLFCCMVIFLLMNKKINYLLIAVFSFFAISTNEIYGVSLFMVFIAYLFLFRYDKKILIFSICSLLISIILICIIQWTAEPNLTQNSSFHSIFSGSLLTIIVNLYKKITSYQSSIFLLVNFVFGGLFILFRPKLILVWLFFLLPNLVIDVGKLGWATHYHISYFVLILWLMVYGLSLINLKNKTYITLFLIIYLFFISRFNVDNYKFNESEFILSKIYDDYKSIVLNKKDILEKFNRLQSSVDINDKISTPEALSYPFLKNKISYYPMDIDGVDKVILFFDKSKSGDNRFYSINYGQQDDKLDICILKRMRNNNFNLDNPNILGDFVIIEKK